MSFDIHINLVDHEKTSDERIERVIEAIDAKSIPEYKIALNILWYKDHLNLPNRLVDYGEYERFGIYVRKYHYNTADSKNISAEMDENLASIINGSLCFTTINPRVKPLNGFVKSFRLETFEDQNYGSIYCDYYTISKKMSSENVRIVNYQKSMPVKSNVLPLVFFSTKAFMDNIKEQNPQSKILSLMLSRHILEPLCILN